MPDKALFDVDMKIARLREQMAAGQVSLDAGMELDRLLQQRMDLLAQIEKSKQQELGNRP